MLRHRSKDRREPVDLVKYKTAAPAEMSGPPAFLKAVRNWRKAGKTERSSVLSIFRSSYLLTLTLLPRVAGAPGACCGFSFAFRPLPLSFLVSPFRLPPDALRGSSAFRTGRLFPAARFLPRVTCRFLGLGFSSGGLRFAYTSARRSAGHSSGKFSLANSPSHINRRHSSASTTA